MNKIVIAAFAALALTVPSARAAAGSLEKMLTAFGEATQQEAIVAQAAEVQVAVPAPLGAPVVVPVHQHAAACQWTSDAYSRRHHAEANRARAEHHVRRRGHQVFGSYVVERGRYWYVVVDHSCRRHW